MTYEYEQCIAKNNTLFKTIKYLDFTCVNLIYGGQYKVTFNLYLIFYRISITSPTSKRRAGLPGAPRFLDVLGVLHIGKIIYDARLYQKSFFYWFHYTTFSLAS